MSVSRRCAALLLLAGMAVGTHAVTAPAASALVDPAALVNSLNSLQPPDPIVMANCATGTVEDPVGALTVPPEVPVVGCLTL